MSSLKKSVQLAPRFSSIIRSMADSRPTNDSAGAIRAAGGGFARMEIAHEEEYFYKKRHEQLAKLKEKSVSESDYRTKAIKDHEAAIQRHKEAIDQLSKSK